MRPPNQTIKHRKNNPAKPIGPAGYKGEEAKDKISYATNYVILMPA